jgi:WD40 repeat protein
MPSRKRSPMNKPLILLGIGMLLLSACKARAAVLPPTATLSIHETDLPTVSSTPTSLPEPTATPTAAAAVISSAAPCSATFYPVGFSQDGKNLFGLESVDGVEKTWLQALQLEDLTAQTVATLDDSIAVATISPDRQTLAWALPDFSIQLIQLNHGTVLATLVGHQALVNALLFSTDGSQLYSASSDTSVMVWDLKKLSKQSAFKPSFNADDLPGEVLGLGLAPDGKTVITIPMDGSARAWDTTTFQQLGEYPGVISGAYNGSRALYSPDGKYLAIGLAAGPGDTSLWRMPDGAQVWSGGFLSSFDFSPDAHLFAYVEMDPNNRPRIVIGSPDGQTIYHTIQPPTDTPQMKLQFSPDGKTLVTTTGAQIFLWNTSDGTLKNTYRPACP